MIYLFSSVISATAVMLLYFLLTFSFDKDVYWLLRLKLEKAILLVVTGVILVVVIERWIEQVLSALLDKM